MNLTPLDLDAVKEDPAEAAYWIFDALRNERTTSERGAFKAAYRTVTTLAGRLSGERVRTAAQSVIAAFNGYCSNSDRQSFETLSEVMDTLSAALAAAGSDEGARTRVAYRLVDPTLSAHSEWNSYDGEMMPIMPPELAARGCTYEYAYTTPDPQRDDPLRDEPPTDGPMLSEIFEEVRAVAGELEKMAVALLSNNWPSVAVDLRALAERLERAMGERPNG